MEMSKLFLRLILVAGVGMTGAACQDDGYGAPRGAYQPAPAYGYQAAPVYSQPAPVYYNSGYAPAPARYGYAQPAPNYNPTDGRRYTTVTVTNRGQNGYRDDVVQQQVVCGSQYYDGYRTRTAPRC
jgi:hypothetical protein